MVRTNTVKYLVHLVYWDYLAIFLQHSGDPHAPTFELICCLGKSDVRNSSQRPGSLRWEATIHNFTDAFIANFKSAAAKRPAFKFPYRISSNAIFQCLGNIGAFDV